MKCPRYGLMALGAGALCLSAGAFGQSQAANGTEDMLKDLRARMNELEARDAQNREVIASLQSQLRAVAPQDEPANNWLTNESSEQVRALVADALADANTRASLLQDGGTAGHDGGFYLASPDGTFRLNIKGLIQARHMVTLREGDSTSLDGTESGFQIMRANLFFSGHVGDPRIKYLITLASSRSTGTTGAESAKITYDYDDNFSVYAGRFRNLAFLREERISYTKQLAVERSYLNEIFTLDYVEGIGFNWQDDKIRFQGVYHDGAYSAPTDYTADMTDFAVNGRLDFLLAGTWDEAEDFTAMGTEETSSVIGAAIGYEVGETGTTGPNNEFYTWTVDGSYESGGFGVYAAIMGRSGDNEATPDPDQYGILVQGSVLMDEKFEPFGRFEWFDLDGFADVGGSSSLFHDEVIILTGGFNYYIRKHAAKVTFDVLYALDPIPMSRTNTGLLADIGSEDGQIAVRTQFQLLF